MMRLCALIMHVCGFMILFHSAVIAHDIVTAHVTFGALLACPVFFFQGRARPISVDKRLTDMIEIWSADDRFAYETIDALERDVWKIITGKQTTDKTISRMPLR